VAAPVKSAYKLTPLARKAGQGLKHAYREARHTLFCPPRLRALAPAGTYGLNLGICAMKDNWDSGIVDTSSRGNGLPVIPEGSSLRSLSITEKPAENTLTTWENLAVECARRNANQLVKASVLARHFGKISAGTALGAAALTLLIPEVADVNWEATPLTIFRNTALGFLLGMSSTLGTLYYTYTSRKTKREDTNDAFESLTLRLLNNPSIEERYKTASSMYEFLTSSSQPSIGGKSPIEFLDKEFIDLSIVATKRNSDITAILEKNPVSGVAKYACEAAFSKAASDVREQVRGEIDRLTTARYNRLEILTGSLIRLGIAEPGQIVNLIQQIFNPIVVLDEIKTRNRGQEEAPPIPASARLSGEDSLATDPVSAEFSLGSPVDQIGPIKSSDSLAAVGSDSGEFDSVSGEHQSVSGEYESYDATPAPQRMVGRGARRFRTGVQVVGTVGGGAFGYYGLSTMLGWDSSLGLAGGCAAVGWFLFWGIGRILTPRQRNL